MSLQWRPSTDHQLLVATLDNGRGLEVRVMNFGATLLSVRAPDRRGAQHDVTLGFDEPEQYLGPHPYFGATIGRYANRIAGARFEIDRRAHQLVANEGPNQLHGGSRGFDKVLWTLVGERAGDAPGVRWRYVSPAGEQGHPGALEVEVAYSLAGESLRIDFTAAIDAPGFINLTNHAYWNLAGSDEVLGHELQLFGARFLPVNDELLPTGELRLVSGTPMDFLKPALIGARLSERDPQLVAGSGGYDHCWALDRSGPGLQLAARLSEPASGRVMEVSTTQPGLQFYSGNQLDGRLVGKAGRAYERHAGLCLETQHFPDSPHHPGFPNTLLRPGETYRHSAAYRFFTL